MSKKLLLLILTLFSQLAFFPKISFAVSTCKDSKIEVSPSYFPENTTGYKLKFTILSQNVLSELKLSTDPVQLVINGQTISDKPTIKSTDFEINLPTNLTTLGVYRGTLQWIAPGDTGYSDYCELVYQVGAAGNECSIGYPPLDLPIPLSSTLVVRFLGRANRPYNLTTNTHRVLAIGPGIQQNTTTDASGQGTFTIDALKLKDLGSNGDTVTLTIELERGIGSLDMEPQKCWTNVKIKAGSNPPDPNPPPVGTAPAGAKDILICPKEGEAFDPKRHIKEACTKGGGDPCIDPNNPNNPALKTAIGCIHTNPAEFTKDLLKFIIGIGGGLAFLMMLLGAYQMLSSGGNPESLKAGQERLTSAVIGLLFIIFSILLLQIIGVGILAIPGFK